MKPGTDLGLTENIAYPILDHEIESRLKTFDGATFSHIYNEIPPFAEAEMERLYGNIYSSVQLFRIKGELENTQTYIDWKNGKIRAVIIFRRIEGTIFVMNELIRLAPGCIRRFVKNVFAMFDEVRCIVFNAIQTGALRLSYPSQRFNCSENIVISLPDSPEQYMESLGKNLRKSLKYYASRIKREHPSYRYQILEGRAADESCIRKIIDFNVARMAEKSKVSGMNEDEIRNTIGLVQKLNGFIGVTTVNGELCAGEICCRVGSNYFILSGSHDPAFNDYRLGMLSQYMTICEFIRRGGKECHFTWGREEYKYRLKGVRRDLDRIIVYRSHAQLLLNPRLALRTIVDGRIRQARIWLIDPEQKDRPAVKLAHRSIKTIRKGMNLLRSTSMAA